jgi:hypothetical protein
VFGAAVCGSATISAGGGFTLVGGSSTCPGLEYEIVSSTGSYDPTFGATGDGWWGAFAVSYH